MRHWKSLLLTVLVTALLCRSVPVARADDPAYISTHCPLTSTAMIVVPLEKNTVSQGSGFIVDRETRLLLTNYHVVSEKSKIEALFPVYEEGKARADRALYWGPKRKAQPYSGKVIDRDAGLDLALIELDSLPDFAPELKLAADSPDVNARVHASGNPGNDTRAFVYTLGKAHAVDPQKRMVYQNNQKVAARVLEIETDHKMSGGTSGGPVVNDSGELVGVIAATPPDSSLTALCIDIREVRGFLGRALRNRGTAFLLQKEYDKAIAACDQAVKYNPKDALTFNERGAAYSWKSDYDKAAENYSTALKLDPTLASTWRNRGSAYLHKGEFDKAVADCTEAIRLDKNFALAYLTRSRAYTKLKNDDAAREDYDTARRLDASLR